MFSLPDTGESGAMTTTLLLSDIPRDSVVVGVDGSDGSDHALDWAADEAARQQRTLTVVHTAAPPAPWLAGGYGAVLMDPVAADNAILALGRSHTAAARERAAERHPELEIVEVADVLDPRLGLVVAGRHAHTLVVGSRGRGPLLSLVLGSVSVAVTRQASCPVVVVRPGEVAGESVLVLVDGTAASLPVLEYAVRAASETGRSLHVTHLLWTAFDIDHQLFEEGERLLSEVTAGLGERYPDVAVTTELAHFVSPEQVIEAAADAALVVVGHHPTSRLHQVLYRSVSTGVLEHADTPVVVVPTALDTADGADRAHELRDQLVNR